MNKKKLKVLGVVIAFVLCFPLHFLYDLMPNFITSIFLPVNESIAEHMKILFGSIMISSVIQKIIVIKKDLNIKNICISNFTGAVLSIPIFLLIFVPIYNTIGENMPITIFLMFITIVISQIISYIIINSKNLGLENVTIFLVIIVYIIFGLLTYFPPENDLFMDPTNLTYGITK